MQTKERRGKERSYILVTTCKDPVINEGVRYKQDFTQVGIKYKTNKMGSNNMRYNLFTKRVHHTTHIAFENHIALCTHAKMMEPSCTCSE